MDLDELLKHAKGRVAEITQAFRLEEGTDEEMLNYVLNVMSVKQSGELSQRLLREFGTFAQVVNSSADDLLKVPGMDNRITAMLMGIGQANEIFNEDKNCDIKSEKDVVPYFRNYFANMQTEHLVVVFFDNDKIINKSTFTSFEDDSVFVSMSKLSFQIAQCGATRVYVAHNHVYGEEPSYADVCFTNKLKFLTECQGVQLVDHYVFYDGRYICLCGDKSYLPQDVFRLAQAND